MGRTITIWRPFAEIGKYFNDDTARYAVTPLDPAPAQSGTSWPNAADLQYFDSEMRFAFMCLLLAKSGTFESANACTRRAMEVQKLLADWVEAHGGHAGLEQRLTRLRWHLDALPDSCEQ